MRSVLSCLMLGALFLAAWAPVPSPASETAPGDALELSLQEALSTALQRSFDVQVERVSLQTAESGLRGSYGIYDPTLTFNWSAAVSRQPVSSALQVGQDTLISMNRQDLFDVGLSQYTPWGQSFSFGWNNGRYRTNSLYSLANPTYGSDMEFRTTMPLLQGFGTKVGNQAVLRAKWDRRAAGEQFAYQLRDTLVQVETDYWNLLFTIKDLEVKLKALELAKRFQEETRLKIQAGVLAPIEQISADAQVANREQEIILTQTQVGNAEDILKLAMGFTKDSPEWHMHIRPTQDPRDVNPADFSEEDLIAKALEIRPELKEMTAQLEKAKLGTLVARNATLPQLNLVAGLTYNGLAGDGRRPDGYFVDQGFSDAWQQIWDLDYESWVVGLSLRYPIGNRAARYAYQGAKLQQTSTEILFEKKRLVVANEVRFTLRNLEAAHKRVSASKVNLDLQKQKLDAEEKKFQNGLSTSFQVLSYQNDLMSAATVLLRASLDREIAHAQLDRAVGTYLEGRGIEAGNGR